MNTSTHESPACIPTVNERLGHLRPSRELLEYYRSKIAEFDGEYDALLDKLEQYKKTCESEHTREWEIRQREEEIAELQKALSDMQVFLFQEREHVLRLYAENDRLKIRELEDRKKIQHLLSLSQPVLSETTYFHKEPPAKVIVHQHQRKKQAQPQCPRDPTIGGRGPGGHKHIYPLAEREIESKGKTAQKQSKEEEEDGVSSESLALTVSALKAQLEEQTRLCKEQVEGLLADRSTRNTEAEAREQRDSDHIKALMERLRKAQDLLYSSTKDFLDVKYELRAKERAWMSEKDKLLQKLDHYRQELDANRGIDPVLGMSFAETSEDSVATRATVNQLKMQLQQAQQLSENYREQCVKLEEQVCQLREATEVSQDMYKDKAERVTKRMAAMSEKYQALEKRRGLEIQGYKTDIKMLRQRMNDLEKQLYKLTLSLSGNQDTEILSAVKRTTANTRKLLGDLQHLKTKVYGMEKKVLHVHDL
jgi:coiled-coil domain-containing protein 77